MPVSDVLGPEVADVFNVRVVAVPEGPEEVGGGTEGGELSLVRFVVPVLLCGVEGA